MDYEKYKNMKPYPDRKLASKGEYLEYNLEEDRLTQLFWDDLAVDLDLNSLPRWQKQRLQTKAWEAGHSNGLEEVAIIAGDLIDLIRE